MKKNNMHICNYVKLICKRLFAKKANKQLFKSDISRCM